MFRVIRTQSLRVWFGARYVLSLLAFWLFISLGLVLILNAPFPTNLLGLVMYLFLGDLAWERRKTAKAAYEMKAFEAGEAVADRASNEKVGRAYAAYQAWQQANAKEAA